MNPLILFPVLIAQTIATLSLSEGPNKGPVNDYVGTATIHAYQDSNGVTGHCFLTIKNTTSSAFFVGHLNLYAGQKLSVGTWDTQFHSGIFYNYEHYSDWTWIGNPCVSLSVPINDLDLDVIHTSLRNPSNNVYNYYFTSATFAVTVWNSFAPLGLQVTSSDGNNVVYSSIASKSGALYSSSIPSNANVGYVQNNVLFYLP